MTSSTQAPPVIVDVHPPSTTGASHQGIEEESEEPDDESMTPEPEVVVETHAPVMPEVPVMVPTQPSTPSEVPEVHQERGDSSKQKSSAVSWIVAIIALIGLLILSCQNMLKACRIVKIKDSRWWRCVGVVGRNINVRLFGNLLYGEFI